MRVFVVGTGRCGTLSLVRAAGHITNFTAGHESRWGQRPVHRLAYADQHIEADNRLSWFLGSLIERFPDDLYVHLRRDARATAQSYVSRWKWDPPYRYHRAPRWMQGPALYLENTRTPGSIVESFAYAVNGRLEPWERSERLALAEQFVGVVNSNIELMLRSVESMTIDLEDFAAGFEALWLRIGAQGNLGAALVELDRRHNAS